MNLKLPKGINIGSLNMSLSQEEDSCGRTEESYQELEVEFSDAGGGFYYILKTDRWAIDRDEHSLFKCLDNICKDLDKNSIFKEGEKKWQKN